MWKITPRSGKKHPFPGLWASENCLMLSSWAPPDGAFLGPKRLVHVETIPFPSRLCFGYWNLRILCPDTFWTCVGSLPCPTSKEQFAKLMCLPLNQRTVTEDWPLMGRSVTPCGPGLLGLNLNASKLTVFKCLHLFSCPVSVRVRLFTSQPQTKSLIPSLFSSLS